MTSNITPNHIALYIRLRSGGRTRVDDGPHPDGPAPHPSTLGSSADGSFENERTDPRVDQEGHGGDEREEDAGTER